MDLVTYHTGKWIESKLEERDKKNKPIYKLEDLLADPQEGAGNPLFGSLAGRVTRKVQIKPDGTWDD